MSKVCLTYASIHMQTQDGLSWGWHTCRAAAVVRPGRNAETQLQPDYVQHLVAPTRTPDAEQGATGLCPLSDTESCI